MNFHMLYGGRLSFVSAKADLIYLDSIGRSEGSDSEWFARRGLQWQHNFPRELRPGGRPAQAPASQVWTYTKNTIVKNVCQKYPILSSQVFTLQNSKLSKCSKQLLLSEFQSTSSEGQVRTATACILEASSVSIWIHFGRASNSWLKQKEQMFEVSLRHKALLSDTTYCIEVGQKFGCRNCHLCLLAKFILNVQVQSARSRQKTITRKWKSWKAKNMTVQGCPFMLFKTIKCHLTEGRNPGAPTTSCQCRVQKNARAECSTALLLLAWQLSGSL